MAQPTDDLVIWASSDVSLPNLASSNKSKPSDDLILKGWDFKEKPAADEFNYILNNLGQWTNWAVTDLESATPNNTNNTIVKRDTSGDFSASTITADLNGNASTASKWKTTRGLRFTGYATGSGSFDGSDDVSILLSYGTGFSSSKTANGWMYRPDDIIEQWGTASITISSSSGGKILVTLPVTYPNNLLNVQATLKFNNILTDSSSIFAFPTSLGSITLVLDAPGVTPLPTGTYEIYWRTIGS